MSPAVSVIIPAHNAASTLAETLDSLRAQTWPHWEAIIVENASTDATVSVAGEYARRDERIRLHLLSDKGVSQARNAGLELARHEWVLFLDADDWIVPTHLQRMLGVLTAHPHLDAVHCGWARVTSGRTVMWDDIGPSDEDLFPHLARTCVFAIHACIARRARLLAVGGFDSTLCTGEDWDLWLRVARAGARFGHVPEVLAHYRARNGSASMNPVRLVQDSLVVLRRAYTPDPRVQHPVPEHADGATPEHFPLARMQNLMWGAGLAVGLGQDPHAFLEDLAPAEFGFDPTLFSNCLHGAVIAATGEQQAVWTERFNEFEPVLTSFLAALEKRSGHAALARCTWQHLERQILDTSTCTRPFTLRSTHAVEVEVSQPLPSLTLPAAIERVHCRVTVTGQTIGSFELPVIDGRVSRSVLADAIAAEFAWPILARYFARTLYPSFVVEPQGPHWRLRRGAQVLATGLPSKSPDWLEVHNQIGWTVFLQEAWGQPDLTERELYFLPPRDLAQFTDATGEPGDPWVTIELSERLRDRRVPGRRATAILTVGGVAVARRGLVRRRQRVSARALRVAFTIECAFELCRAAVREALIGQDWSSAGSLRERLAERARARRALSRTRLPQLEHEMGPAAGPTAGETWAETGVGSLWGRRADGACGTSVSRRATLPAMLREDLQKLAATDGEPLLPRVDSAEGSLYYAPDIFWRAPATPKRDACQETYDGGYFEELFASSPDPWKYTSAYEKTKYQQTLELLPQSRFRRALEVACAEGHFTQQLAPRVERLLATDVSPTALRRTQERCAAHHNIDYCQLDLLQDEIRGRFDLIVCSEVLYYTGSHAALVDVAEKFVRALRPGGYLVTAHAHALVDDPTKTGFIWDVPFGGKVIGDVLAHTPGLRLHRELRTPLYRIQVFERAGPLRRWLHRQRPNITVLSTPPAPLEPDVAAHVVWEGLPTTAHRTERLPILMYHRVADEGPAALSRYRVTLAAFEAQLAHLRAVGYTSASLEEWRRAITTKQPLPGRRVMITFDDGYRDFIQNAWPLLQRHGFTATVFLPTGLIGTASTWDAAHGAPAPLMDWPEILQLDREGTQFGSHTVSHPLLTSLPPEQIAAELLRSRALLQEYLGEKILSLAYPFGDHDRVVETLAGACGYLYGFTCEDRASCLDDRLLALPRLEVRGTTTLAEFRRMLGERRPEDSLPPFAGLPSQEEAGVELSALR